ncbi:outer membrane autotransporter [Dactylonectria macrodidyma]|uniref:Outer membrane autotransporter n=1 Tax=Dactylonectria macrodidyma TaxID=307937 RepID=A0A9P9E3N0_9HYPO|nr:outer membrane autotransporter [Dactylonectria macrodidyma]
MVGWFSSLAAVAITVSVAVATPASSAGAVLSTTCNDKSYTYNELAGYGFVPSAARDKYGDSISLGSSIAFASWAKKGSKYQGKLYGLPDRGWNTNGTVNFQPRIHEFTVTLTLASGATVQDPSPPNVAFVYEDTILLTGPDGNPITGLDADQTGGLKYSGFPILPAATYTGDGFGGDGSGGKRATLDAEALVLAEDGGFWISDEYGPYIYKFNKKGKMTVAVAPPDAILSLRNGSVSFSSNNPPLYNPEKEPVPSDPTQGRQTNQGFEGMTASPDGKSLWVLLQSVALQDGGQAKKTRRYSRLLQYSIKGKGGHGQTPTPVYKAEYVVPLPTFTDTSGKKLVAAQSEMHFVSDKQFFFLPRDSNNGHGMSNSESVYRHIDIFDISAATNVKGATHDGFNDAIASSDGVLNDKIVPATVCSFLDFNVNSQLNRFGMHNGGSQDGALLNEKWEGIALVPVDRKDRTGKSDGDEYFLFASSDNDFVTQNGFMNFGRNTFSDESGYDLDSQMLVFRVTLPKGSKPLVG